MGSLPSNILELDPVVPAPVNVWNGEALARTGSRDGFGRCVRQLQ